MASFQTLDDAFASMKLGPGEGPTSADIDTMIEALRGLGVCFSNEAIAKSIAKEQIESRMSRLNINDVPASPAADQARNDRESRSRSTRSPFSGAAVSPRMSPFGGSHRGRSKSPARPRSRSPFRNLFGVNRDEVKYQQMNEAQEEEFHDARSVPSPVQHLDPSATIRPQFANMNINPHVQFSVGTSGPVEEKKRASPGKLKARRNRTPRTTATTATPGVQSNASFTSLSSPPTPNSFTKPPTPSSFYNPSTTAFVVPQPPAQQPTQPQHAEPEQHTSSHQVNPTVQQEPSQPQNPTGQQRKKLHAKRPSKAAAANPFFSPTPTFPQQAIFGGDSAMLPRRQQPNSAERAAAAATSAKLFVDSPTSHPNTPADSNNANPPPSEKHTCARTRRCESNTPYTTTDGGSNGFNFRVDLKPEEKKMVGRGRAFRRGLKQDFGVPIHHTNTEDTASSTDNSPSSTSTGDMSFMHFASPPPAPAPAGTQAYWQPQPPHAQAPFVSVHQPVYPSAPPAEGTVQFNIGAASAKPKKNQGRKLSAVERQRQANLEQQRILEDKISKVMVYRDSAKMLYKSGDYCKCIMACTTGVDLYQKELAGVPNTNLLGVLYSNRAAALLMVGAYQAAVDDCSEALQFTSYSSNPGQLVECPPSMIPKLYNRRARARGKMGDIDGADADFHAAIAKATELLAKIQQSGGNAEFLESLNRETIDATNGQMTVMSCRTAWNKARALCNNVTRLCSEQSLDAIEDVNNALSFCSGCSDLQEMKIKLLAHLKRWRELLRYCERIGADKVKMDGCFPGDLELKNPLPGVDHARHLKSTLFDGISDDDVAGVFFRLNYKAKAEVVLRLPYLARPAYVKGLRLQEDYIGAKECIARLEIYLDSKPGLRACFTWLAHEKELISRTESLRSNADFLFGSGKFDEAADEYYKISCLDRNAGGRLNAVMHCNRAACFMAVHKLNEALNECNRALQLHPRYMKALLRRARCHTRLDRYDEAIADYQRYLDYVQKAMDGDTSFIRVSPMVFDGPSSVSQESIKSVRDALDEAQKLKRDKQADDDRRRTEYAQRQWRSERFNGDAQRRRENFYQSSSRPWDSFANRGPRRSPQFSQNDNTRNASNRGGNANQANNAGRASQNQNQRNRQQQTSRSPRHVKDFYEVLQISYQATQADIKKAYRKLALKHHPDKSDDPNAADNFRRIQEAFEKLKDEESRRHYDRERRRGY